MFLDDFDSTDELEYLLSKKNNSIMRDDPNVASIPFPSRKYWIVNEFKAMRYYITHILLISVFIP